MTLYVDTSALVKRYLREAETPIAVRLIDASGHRLTARHTIIEIRRCLAVNLTKGQLKGAQERFAEDMLAFSIVELDRAVCDRAAAVAEQFHVRTLDALHLAAAERAVGPKGQFLSFDQRQTAAARRLGFEAIGAS